MSENVMASEPAPVEAPPPRRRGVLVGVGVLVAAIACLCIVAVIVFAILDPFGWIARLLGGGAGAASVTPPDVPVYVGLDLGRLRTAEVDRLIATFAEATDSDARDLDSAIEQLDESLEEQYGVTITDDVMPWVGQYVGLAGFDLGLGPVAGVQQAQGEWLLAIEARDRRGADAFLERLREQIAEDTDRQFDASEYEGVTLYELSAEPFDEWALARSGSYVLIAGKAETLRAAIDAQRGESLADSDTYQDSLRRLPEGAVVRSYVDFAALAALTEETGAAMFPSPYMGLQSAGVSYMGASGSLVEEGIRLNVSVVYDPELATEAQLANFGAEIEPTAIDHRFPEDTFLFFSTRGISQAWSNIQETVDPNQAYADLLESLRLLEEQIGIDLGDDLLAYLDGEIGVGLAASNEGMLPELMDTQLGLLVLAETTQEDPLRATVEDLSAQITDESGMTLREVTVAGIDAFELGQTFPRAAILVYGVGEGTLFISTGRELVEGAFADGPSLADNETYQTTWDSFPAGSTPAFYLNLEGLLGQIREGQAGLMVQDFDESTAFLDPIHVIAAAGELTEDYTAESTFIAFIDWIEPTE